MEPYLKGFRIRSAVKRLLCIEDPSKISLRGDKTSANRKMFAISLERCTGTTANGENCYDDVTA